MFYRPCSSKKFKNFTVTKHSLWEYCSPAWSPFHKQYINKLESVQRRYLKLEMLPTLTDRRRQADLKDIQILNRQLCRPFIERRAIALQRLRTALNLIKARELSRAWYYV